MYYAVNILHQKGLLLICCSLRKHFHHAITGFSTKRCLKKEHRISTLIWQLSLLLHIGYNKFPSSTTNKKNYRQIKVLTGHQHGISAVVTYTSYWGVRHFVGKTEVAQNVLLNNQRSNNLKYINKHLHENGDFYYFINLTTTKTTTLLTLSSTWIFQYQNNQYNNTWNNVK